ncbi:hypothetical protein SHELI_v1c04740 [Spiroplasma helicoides]|uniref:Uncharacterized protein n=1 Tax=Spiroplasma helicoides TaxID=216938 RepID=A0A1B3SKI8_9MOLU|nr:hypothetical protein [Spiroplasma helicoides]AOG60425.1 hypothetical protein SHELI_v1c04740 [Spiroplasma helicoides]
MKTQSNSMFLKYVVYVSLFLTTIISIAIFVICLSNGKILSLWQDETTIVPWWGFVLFYISIVGFVLSIAYIYTFWKGFDKKENQLKKEKVTILSTIPYTCLAIITIPSMILIFLYLSILQKKDNFIKEPKEQKSSKLSDDTKILFSTIFFFFVTILIIGLIYFYVKINTAFLSEEKVTQSAMFSFIMVVFCLFINGFSLVSIDSFFGESKLFSKEGKVSWPWFIVAQIPLFGYLVLSISYIIMYLVSNKK